MQGTGVIETIRKNVGLELHRNSSPNYVDAYLLYCELKGCVSPEKDASGWATLCQVIANHLGGAQDILVDRPENLDEYNFENGVYTVQDWSIAKHDMWSITGSGDPSCLELLYEINDAQPSREQIDLSAIVPQPSQVAAQASADNERRRLAMEAFHQSQMDYEAMQEVRAVESPFPDSER